MHNRKINEGKKCLISAELISDYNLIMSLIIHSIKKISRILRWKRPKLGYIFQHFFAPTSKWYFMSCVACNLQCVAYFWEKTSINYNYSLLLTLNSLFFSTLQLDWSFAVLFTNSCYCYSAIQELLMSDQFGPVIHTIRKSQIVSKNSIFRKRSKLWIWIFAPKLSKFNNFLLLLMHKIMIFGAKIQIIPV